MELLKRSIVLVALLSAGMTLAACQTSGRASGDIHTPSGAGVGGGVSAGGSVDTPNSNSNSQGSTTR